MNYPLYAIKFNEYINSAMANKLMLPYSSESCKRREGTHMKDNFRMIDLSFQDDPCDVSPPEGESREEGGQHRPDGPHQTRRIQCRV